MGICISSRNAAKGKEAIDKLIEDFSGHPDLREAICVIEQKQQNEARFHLLRIDITSCIQSGEDVGVLTAIDYLIANYKDHPDLSREVFIMGEEYYDKALKASLHIS